jgi:hypothetical protein
MVRDTPPYGHAPTYLISLTYLERQKCYGPDKKILFNLKRSMPPHLIIMDKVVLLGVIFLKMKCVCKTQMMPPPDHQNPVDMHTSIMCINILQNIKAVAPKL